MLMRLETMSTSSSGPSMANDESHVVVPDLEDPQRPSSSVQKRTSPVRPAESANSQRDSTADEFQRPPRLLPRNLPYHQSRNVLRIRNRRRKLLSSLLVNDWFHVFLRLPTHVSLPALMSLWTAIILLFAGVYMGLDRENSDIDCGLTGSPDLLLEFGPAFAFSLETCTTVGYGLPGSTNAFFANCPSVQVAIYAQMVWSMLFNAFLLAFLFARLGKSEDRGYQVVLSRKAVVRYDPAQKTAVFQVRAYDVDSRHAVVEAHVRMYALTASGHPELIPLRISNPNDELSAVMFTSVPTAITHQIDIHSALSPPACKDHPHHGLILRQVDSATMGREDVLCPVCSEAYGSVERVLQHIRYNKIMEIADPKVPWEGTHKEVDIAALQKALDTTPKLPDIRKQVETGISEIFCLLEGIDPLTSGTFQSLQSYRMEDIIWGGTFADCVTYSEEGMLVNLEAFHEVVEDDNVMERGHNNNNDKED